MIASSAVRSTAAAAIYFVHVISGGGKISINGSNSTAMLSGDAEFVTYFCMFRVPRWQSQFISTSYHIGEAEGLIAIEFIVCLSVHFLQK